MHSGGMYGGRSEGASDAVVVAASDASVAVASGGTDGTSRFEFDVRSHARRSNAEHAREVALKRPPGEEFTLDVLVSVYILTNMEVMIMNENLAGRVANRGDVSATKGIGAWAPRVLPYVLALPMVGAGMGKLVGIQRFVDTFHRFGFPEYVRPLVGGLELIGVLLLLLPRTRFVGSIFVFTIFSVAVAVHLHFGEVLRALPPVLALVGTAYLAVAEHRRARMTRAVAEG